MHLRSLTSGRRRSQDRASKVSALLAAAAAVAAPAAAQFQFEELTKRGLPPDSDTTWATALGDVDADGDLDLIVAIVGSSSSGPLNRLYLNNGTGTFTDATAARLPAAGSSTSSLALGDLDGDGDLDLVIGSSGAQNRLYLNDGTGTFTDATAVHMPPDSDWTNSLALGDLDRDGDLDLIVGNSNFSTRDRNRLYLNDGTGTFTDATAARLPASGSSTSSLALGDLDGDGDLDLVVGVVYCYQCTQQNRLYLNNGTGTFTDATAARLPIDDDQTTSLALGDVDGDGDLDLVVGNFQDFAPALRQNRLYLNNGTGTFTDATAARMPVALDDTRALALGDLDGDGDLDLVVGDGGPSNPQQNRLYLNNGTGTFTDATAARMPDVQDRTSSLALGDLDADGDVDLVVGNYGIQDRLYLNNGMGTFTDATAARLPATSDWTTSLALGDLEGDGDLDLVSGNGWQQSRVYLNDGTGTFTDAIAARMPDAQGRTYSLALGDLDGDGDLDLVAGNGGPSGPQQNRLYLNDGTGMFTDATAARMPAYLDTTYSVVLGDLDGDGDLDLVVGNGNYSVAGQQNRMYLNNGTGRFTDATAARMPVVLGDTRSLVLGDLDGDGDLDLVVGNGGSFAPRQNLLHLNDGTGTFTDATAARMPMNLDFTLSLALGDVDGDGDLDLIVGNTGAPVPQLNRLYLNDGAGVFTDATAARVPADNDRTTSLALGDVDADGDLDLVVGNGGSPVPQQNRLYLNLQRQIDAPFVLHVGRTYQLDAYARPGLEIALPFLSTATATIPLPPLGTLGIDPRFTVALQPIVVPQPAGVGSLSIPVPNNPALAGIQIHTQALLIRSLRFTNVNTDSILR